MYKIYQKKYHYLVFFSLSHPDRYKIFICWVDDTIEMNEKYKAVELSIK